MGNEVRKAEGRNKVRRRDMGMAAGEAGRRRYSDKELNPKCNKELLCKS